MKFHGTTFLLSFAFVLVLSPLASAQDVLVWATGNQDGDTQGIADYLMATSLFGSVTASDDPDLTGSALDRYDAVLFFTSFPTSFADFDAIGDLLADYADSGRRVVLATFSWNPALGNTLGGRIVADAISPFAWEGASLYSDVSLASNDADPVWDGVSTLSGYFHDDVALVPGAVEHGTWSDGEPAVASKGNVFAVNLFPDPTGQPIGGDYERLFANALATNVVVTDAPSQDRQRGIVLEQNFPNPFNPRTSIRFSLPTRSDVDLTVFDLRGRKVRTLMQGEMEAGQHTLDFDGTALSSGTYFYRITAGDFRDSRRMMLVK